MAKNESSFYRRIGLAAAIKDSFIIAIIIG